MTAQMQFEHRIEVLAIDVFKIIFRVFGGLQNAHNLQNIAFCKVADCFWFWQGQTKSERIQPLTAHHAGSQASAEERLHKSGPDVLSDVLRGAGVAAPSSSKNASGRRDPEMHQSKKGNPWSFGMQARIGVDAHSGLVHTVRGTAGNVNDVIQANTLAARQRNPSLGRCRLSGRRQAA